MDQAKKSIPTSLYSLLLRENSFLDFAYKATT